jgi:hypothetical protein
MSKEETAGSSLAEEQNVPGGEGDETVVGASTEELGMVDVGILPWGCRLAARWALG